MSDLTSKPCCPRCKSTNISRHMQAAPPQCEAERWAPYQEKGYMCSDCRLIESRWNDAPDYDELDKRWNDEKPPVDFETLRATVEKNMKADEEEDRAWTWPQERSVTTRSNRAAELARNRAYDPYYHVQAAQKRGETLPEHKYGYPVAEGHMNAVLAAPDDDAPRRAYVEWLRSFDTAPARGSALFIERQLHQAELLRHDPRARPAPRLPPPGENEFRTEIEAERLWARWPQPDCKGQYDTLPGLGEAVDVLRSEEIVGAYHYYRGFIEHVALKAARFLEIADELYDLAPIRQLTLTYCKGLDHRDDGLLRALLASPHLGRIRALKLPVRVLDHEYAELNRFADSDLELLAGATHLRGLRYLDLEDESHLTLRGFDALAASQNLPELSAVRHDVYRYSFPASFGGRSLGSQRRELGERPLARYAAALEAKHGRIPWLHVAETYGTEEPDVEAVVEHPSALYARTPRGD